VVIESTEEEAREPCRHVTRVKLRIPCPKIIISPLKIKFKIYALIN